MYSIPRGRKKSDVNPIINYSKLLTPPLLLYKPIVRLYMDMIHLFTEGTIENTNKNTFVFFTFLPIFILMNIFCKKCKKCDFGEMFSIFSNIWWKNYKLSKLFLFTINHDTFLDVNFCLLFFWKPLYLNPNQKVYTTTLHIFISRRILQFLGGVYVYKNGPEL